MKNSTNNKKINTKILSYKTCSVLHQIPAKFHIHHGISLCSSAGKILAHALFNHLDLKDDVTFVKAET